MLKYQNSKDLNPKKCFKHQLASKHSEFSLNTSNSKQTADKISQ